MPVIMVVDDDATSRIIFSEALRQDGYEIIEASDGVEAFKNFKARPAQLVVTDLVMPNKEGLELMQEIRAISPEVKFVVCSGGGHLEVDYCLKFAEGMGADKVFAKPVSIVDFKNAIRQLLD